MKTACDIRGESVVFRVSEFDPKYVPVLEACAFARQGDAFTKSYPASAPNIDRIVVRFRGHAEEMFDQMGYFAPVPWERALSEFADRVEGTGADWWLTGSCAVCVRGIPLNPHDVDIMIASADVPLFNEIFADDLIEPLIPCSGWVAKDFGVIFRHARIDIASDPQAFVDTPEPVDFGPYAGEHLEEVRWQGLTLKVPPLALSLNVNKKRGRTERAETIAHYLAEGLV